MGADEGGLPGAGTVLASIFFTERAHLPNENGKNDGGLVFVGNVDIDTHAIKRHAGRHGAGANERAGRAWFHMLQIDSIQSADTVLVNRH
jgi:hypothetical protein